MKKTINKEAEDEQERILNHSIDLICTAGVDGYFKYLNPAWKRVLGYSIDELLSKPFLDFIHPDDHEKSDEKLQKLSAGKQPIDFENRCICKNGSVRHFHWIATPLPDERKIVCIGRDISEWKQVEKELSYKAELLENVSEAVISTDNDFNIVSWNTGAEILYGWKADEIIGKAFGQVVPVKYVDAAETNVLNQLRKEGYWQGETIQQNKNGDALYMRSSVTVLKDLNGNPTGTVAINQDITEHRRIEQALLDSEERFRTLFESTREGMISTGPDGKIVSANPTAAKMLGYDRPRDIVGMKAADLYADIMQREVMLKALEANDYVEDFEIIAKNRNGKKLYFLVSIAIQRNDNGDYIRSNGIFRDISERKLAEQERLSNLHFLESMDRVNRAIQESNNLEQMMSNVLNEVLSIFDCDRASLVYPCDPEAQSWTAQMERFRPPYEGVMALGLLRVPMNADVAFCHRLLRSSDGPVPFGQKHENQMPDGVGKRFQIRSQLGMAIYPKDGRPWMFVIHQCSYSRFWQERDMRLFQEISRRMEDALTSLLMHRNLQESEQRYRTVADFTYDWEDWVTPDGTFRYVSPSCERITGYAAERFMDDPRLLSKLILPEDREIWLGHERDIREVPGLHEGQFRIRRRDGETRWIEHASQPVASPQGAFLGYRGSNRDITERKQAEQNLKNSRDQLRLLSQRLETVREEERTEIAREIHDELGQNLTVLQIDLSILKKKLPENDKETHEKVSSMSEQLTILSKSIQQISMDLRPGILDDLGLLPAIKWQADEFRKKTGIKCELTLNIKEEDIDLDQHQSTTIYRICQEALTNITRHAEATLVKVVIDEQDGHLILKVEDNGKGISEEQISSSNSLGIIGIKERCISCGGEMNISGGPGKGTWVTVTIPVG
jgi:PAS domain S-box-containing protein